MSRATLLFVFLGFQLLQLGSSRSVTNSNLLISNGLDDNKLVIGQSSSSIVQVVVDDLKADTVTCEPIYGFLPCATSFLGLLFMIIVYEILLHFANGYIQSGSNLFFEMYGTGVFGASLFQMLGIIPQIGIVLVNGVTGSTDTAEAMTTMSMGLLAGSAIMLLTLVWGSVVAFGSYDISESPTSSNTEHFSFTGRGVTTDAETSSTARIMLVSLIPFLILLVAKVISSTSGIRIVTLVALLVSFSLLVTYCVYQMFEPWIQRRRFEYLMRKYVQKTLLPMFLTSSGNLSVSNIQGVFSNIDRDHNTYISDYELRALILGIKIGDVDLEESSVDEVMEDFDISGDSRISEQEFVKGISKWVDATKPSANGKAKELAKEEEEQKQVAKRKESKRPGNSWRNNITAGPEIFYAPCKLINGPPLNNIKAACLVIFGTGIMMLLASPLMKSIQDISDVANIPSFLTSYVVIPLAINYGRALQAITSAQDKNENAISLTLSEIYNGVFMNNVMGLTMFLAIVYIRDLSWDISANILVVLAICTAMGFYTSFSKKFPFWTSSIAYIIYPISLLLIYVLTTYFGWS